MNITSTTITKKALSKKEYADYEIEYVIVNGTLDRVQFSVYVNSEDESNRNYVGSIYLTNDTVSCNLNSTSGIHLFFKDFEKYVNLIIESLIEDKQ